jgi:hypothetical protein
MEAICFSESSISTNESTLRYNPEHKHRLQHSREDLIWRKSQHRHSSGILITWCISRFPMFVKYLENKLNKVANMYSAWMVSIYNFPGKWKEIKVFCWILQTNNCCDKSWYKNDEKWLLLELDVTNIRLVSIFSISFVFQQVTGLLMINYII